MSDTTGHHSSNGNGRKVTPALVLQVGAYLVAMALAYGALSERIARVEERSETIKADLVEIKRDLRRLVAQGADDRQ